MDHVDLILALDKQQHPSHPASVKCAKDKEHGALLPRLDGMSGICCKCGHIAVLSLTSA